MKALLYVLNDPDLLSPLLDELNKAGINGCTIFNTDGMGRELARRDDFSTMIGSLRMLLKPDLRSNKTLMMVLPEEKVAGAVEAIERVVGSLDDVGTGVVITIPVDFIKGLKL